MSEVRLLSKFRYLGLLLAILCFSTEAREYAVGFHVHRLTSTDKWRLAGITKVRVHDMNVTWADIERQEDKYDFTRLDEIMRAAEAGRSKVLYVLQATPRFYSTNPDSKGAYGLGANYGPHDLRVWEKFVGALARRYKGRIEAYEIWNEPNLDMFFKGGPKIYSDLVRGASKAIRAADPGAKIACGSVTGSYGVPWLDSALAEIDVRACDVVSYHLYTNHSQPESFVPTVRAIGEVMRKRGYGKLPLWNTETGWLIQQNFDFDGARAGWKPDAKVLDVRTAMTYFIRANLIAASERIERFYWYSWDHKFMGLTLDMGSSGRALSNNAGRWAKMVSSADTVDCERRDAIAECRLQFGSESINIRWAEDAKSTPIGFPKSESSCRQFVIGSDGAMLRVSTRDYASPGVDSMTITDCTGRI